MATLENGDSAPYWQAAREGRLIMQKCRGCAAVQFPPRYHCASCWEEGLDWIDCSGQGRVESFTIVRRAPLPAFRGRVPYVVAAVLLAEGPRMITNLDGADALDVAIGDAVTVGFSSDSEGNVLPHFERTPA